MGKRILIALFCPTFLISGSVLPVAHAEKIIAVISRSLGPYQEALKGYEQESKLTVQEVNLDGDVSKGSQVTEMLSAEKADGVLAVGTEALAVLKMIPVSTPAFYTMVLEPLELPGRKTSGVLMQISVNDQMLNISKLLPAVKKVGVIYNPNSSKKSVNQAREVAGNYGLTLSPIAVENASEVSGALTNLTRDKVDAIWSVVDSTVAQPAVIGQIIQHAGSQKIPFIGLSVFHVKAGALAAFSVDFADIGTQTASLTKKVLAGGANKVETPRRIVIYVNAEVQKQLGLDLSKAPNVQMVN